jgi:serine/threonine protein kinase
MDVANRAVPLVKLCDFAHSKLLTGLQGSVASTFVAPYDPDDPFLGSLARQEHWEAPEMMGRRGYRKSLDMWGVGLLVFFVSTGSALLRSPQEVSDRQDIRRLALARGEEALKDMSDRSGAVASSAVSGARLLDDNFSFWLRLPLIVDLVCSSVVVAPEQRASALTAMKHPATWTGSQLCGCVRALMDASDARDDKAQRAVHHVTHSGCIPPDWDKQISPELFKFLEEHSDLRTATSNSDRAWALLRGIRNVMTHPRALRRIANPAEFFACELVRVCPRLFPLLVQGVLLEYGERGIVTNPEGLVEFCFAVSN